MKKMDARYRKALLNYYVGAMMDESGVDTFMEQLIIDSSALIAAISERLKATGLEGNRRNYQICEHIAALKIKLEQASLIWSADNIHSFDLRNITFIEDVVRAHRTLHRQPRKGCVNVYKTLTKIANDGLQ